MSTDYILFNVYFIHVQNYTFFSTFVVYHKYPPHILPLKLHRLTSPCTVS